MRHTDRVVLILAGLIVFGSSGLVLAQGRTGIEGEALRLLAEANAAFEQGDLVQAEAGYRKALQIDPMLGEAYERYSLLLFAAKRYKEGANVARDGLRRLSGEAALSATLGMHLFQQGKLRDAHRLLKPAVAGLGERFEIQYVAGQCCMRIGDYACADHALQNYLSRRPANLAKADGPVQAMLGTALLKVGQLDRAEPILRQALRSNPRQLQARTALAELYLRRRNFGRAAAAYEAVLAEARPLEVRLPLGHAYLGLRRYRDALAQADRYLAVHASSLDALLLRGDAEVGLDMFDRALADYRRAASFAGGSVAIKLRVADILLRRNEYDRSLAELAPLLSRADTDPAALVLAVRASIRGGRATVAMTYASRLLKRKDVTADHLTYAAMAHSSAGRFEEARSLLEKALAASPQHHLARAEAVRVLCSLARRHLARAPAETAAAEHALADLERALKIDPDSLVVNRDLALVHLRLGHHGRALAHTATILRKVPLDYNANRLAGRAHLRMEQNLEANTRFEVAAAAVRKVGGVALARALAELAVARTRLGKLDAAVADLEKAQALSRLDLGAQHLLAEIRRNLTRLYLLRGHGLLMKGGETRKAWADLRAALAGVGDLPATEGASARALIAFAALSFGGPSELSRTLEGELRGKLAEVLRPPYDRLGDKLLSSYAAAVGPALGPKLAAARHFEASAKEVPPPASTKLSELAQSVLEQAAVLLFKAGKRSEARGAMEKLRAAGQLTSPEQRHNQAVLDYGAGNREAALAALSAVSARVPLALCNLGVHHELSGNPAQAFELFQQCERRGATLPGLPALLEARRRVLGGRP